MDTGRGMAIFSISSACGMSLYPARMHTRLERIEEKGAVAVLRVTHPRIDYKPGSSSFTGEFNCARLRWDQTKNLGGTRASQTESERTKPVEKKGAGSILTFLCPLLKLFGGGDPAAPRNVFLETATSGLASLARLPWGSQVNSDIVAERTTKAQPSQLIRLYEFEACPFCRRVREALTELDLSAEIYPCPKGSLKHRLFVKDTGGQEQFPFLVDPNTGVSMYESSEIVNYLYKQYGGGRKPSFGLLEREGMTLYPSAVSSSPAEKLELYNYENNQFARLVREALCELELPYVLRNVGKGSALRESFLKIAGSTQVPYLVDPNTGRSMSESQDIISYLFATYADVK